jgi:hypothetical protein
MDYQQKMNLVTRAGNAGRTPDEIEHWLDDLLYWQQTAEDAQARAALLDAYEQPISEGVQHDDLHTVPSH